MSKEKKKYMWLIIGLLIFAAGFIIPPFGALTQMGMKVLGVLLGMVVIMTGFGDMLVTAYLGLFVLVLSGYATGSSALGSLMGSATIVQMFFMVAYCYILEKTGVTETLAKKIMSVKFVQGKPVLFTAVFLFACGVCAILMSPTSVLPVYLALWEGVAHQIGLKADEKYNKLMLMGVYISMFIGTAVLPFKGLLAIWIAYYEKILASFGFTFNLTLHMVLVVGILIVFCIIYALAIKFIYRADMSKLVGFDINTFEGMSKDNLKFTNRQIVCLVTFILTMLYALVPTFLPAGDFATEWNRWHLCIVAMFFMALLGIFKCPDDGKPYANLGESLKNGVPWGPYLIAFVFLSLSGAMSDETLGIAATLKEGLGFMTNMGWVPFTFFAILIPHIITNFFSNMGTFTLIASVVAPLAAPFFTESGMNLTPLCTALIIASLDAYWTAAGSPAAPWMYDREGMSQGWVIKNGLISSALLVIILWLFVAILSPIL